MRLECRECDAICERVVHPWRCLRSNCEGIYMYEDGETMYFGCLYKVFAAEFDLAFFCEAPLQAVPASRRAIKSTDPFGPVRVVRPPRPQCAAEVEQAYDCHSTAHGCCNPTFFHHPFAAGADTMKLTAMPSNDDARDPET